MSLLNIHHSTPHHTRTPFFYKIYNITPHRSLDLSSGLFPLCFPYFQTYYYLENNAHGTSQYVILQPMLFPYIIYGNPKI
jgi:hypothetical protein